MRLQLLRLAVVASLSELASPHKPCATSGCSWLSYFATAHDVVIQQSPFVVFSNPVMENTSED